MRSAPSICGFGSMGVNGHKRSGLKTAFFGSASRTTASSRRHSLSCRRGCLCLMFLVGSCYDSSGGLCWVRFRKLQDP
ncbi:hypothetical protein Bca4012_071238 [Brassica carinata]